MKTSIYTAEDISATIINYASKNNHNITNLQLQKLLYFMQVEYIKETSKLLFPEEFQAWTYGPVQYDVWRYYRLYNRKTISKVLIGTVISDNILDSILKDKIEMYFRQNVWKLVEQSHREAPWAEAIEKNERYISNASIMEFALGV
ncbi:DUF4065 domain-containing protein [Mollicutes bacterium LVI A0039]|nr:DUF4065 domain-containing protein [Mollicutes bacterium LVI A0039]